MLAQLFVIGMMRTVLPGWALLHEDCTEGWVPRHNKPPLPTAPPSQLPVPPFQRPNWRDVTQHTQHTHTQREKGGWKKERQSVYLLDPVLSAGLGWQDPKALRPNLVELRMPPARGEVIRVCVELIFFAHALDPPCTADNSEPIPLHENALRIVGRCDYVRNFIPKNRFWLRMEANALCWRREGIINQMNEWMMVWMIELWSPPRAR